MDKMFLFNVRDIDVFEFFDAKLFLEDVVNSQLYEELMLAEGPWFCFAFSWGGNVLFQALYEVESFGFL